MKKIFFVLIFLVLSGCAQLRPFEDMRREAGQKETVGISTQDMPAICYNPLWSDEKDVQKLAELACQKTKRQARFDSKKHFSCSLMLPSVAFYKCY
ncbi:MAG: hypothetical protein E7021_01900 [Alphaproteobacteria bacterium]|nr:hypothetical protein [Alphaproteobacteria bacterium]